MSIHNIYFLFLSLLFTCTSCIISICWVLSDVPLTDLLAQFDELHLCWHVSHGPHALPQVFVADVAFVVPVKLPEGLTELWQTHDDNIKPGEDAAKLWIRWRGLTIDLLWSQLSVLLEGTRTLDSHILQR